MPRLFSWTLSLCLRSLQMHFVIWDAGSLEALWPEPGFYNGLYQPWHYKSERRQRGASVTMRLICVTVSLCASCMLSSREANVWRSSVLYHACWTHWFVDVRWHILFSVSFKGGSLWSWHLSFQLRMFLEAFLNGSSWNSEVKYVCLQKRSSQCFYACLHNVRLSCCWIDR